MCVAEAVVVGGGRIGSVTALFLSEMGFNVLVVEGDRGKVRVLRERYGFNVVGANVFSGEADHFLKNADVVVLALPGSIGFRALEKVLALGVRNIVDVSYMAEDPLVLSDVARRKGSRVIVDAGLAPGLSNLFVGYTYSMLSSVNEVLIYVGGLAEDPKCPLGLAATWNPRDLVEEYVRPARILVNGKVKSVDPLEYSGTVFIPNLGLYEYFVSDGLRTMLKSLKPPRKIMAEYTLRYPGHLEKMKVLSELGFLSSMGLRVGECEVEVLDFTANVLGFKLSECSRDRVVMYINVTGTDREGKPVSYELLLDEDYDDAGGITAMAKTTSGTQACTTKLLVERGEDLEHGVYGLEVIGLRKDMYKCMIDCVQGLGLKLSTWKKVRET